LLHVEVQIFSEVGCLFYSNDVFVSLSVYSRHFPAFPGRDQVRNVRNCDPEAKSQIL
jgi:hypothetical protein